MLIRRWFVSVALAGCILLLAAGTCLAIASTDHLAGPGQKIAAQPTWPAGVETFVNDPARTDAWHGWFSGLPNDVNEYQFRAADMAELNGLVERFARIESDELQFLLSPDVPPERIGWGQRLAENQRQVAVFQIGNQQILDQWFAASQARCRRAPHLRRASSRSSADGPAPDARDLHPAPGRRPRTAQLPSERDGPGRSGLAHGQRCHEDPAGRDRAVSQNATASSGSEDRLPLGPPSSCRRPAETLARRILDFRFCASGAYAVRRGGPLDLRRFASIHSLVRPQWLRARLQNPKSKIQNQLASSDALSYDAARHHV